MDPEYKQKWIDALRSGKYKQGRAALRNIQEDTYCCLGVLCEIAGAKWTPVISHLEGSRYARATLDGYCSSTATPGLKILEAANLSFEDQDTLIQLNDGPQGKSFEEIAQYIEENL